MFKGSAGFCPLLAWLMWLLSSRQACAIDGPLAPEQSLQYLKTEPGLKVELVAAEPMVVDPVAVAWDEKGRMFVVEDRGYPTGPGKGKPPLGQVVLLEDTDGDGKYDKRTVFADGLTFPNGVMCWKGGVYVTCAPYLYYFKDTDGDGKADVKEIVFKGFQDLSTTQLRVSHPTLNLDNWVYLTSGLTAAKVTSPAHTNRPAVFLNRVDGRFRPFTDVLEETAGTAQFGQTFDRFGRKFICSNRNHIQHVVMPLAYLKRNPNLSFSQMVEDIPDHEAACRVYPLSANITTAAWHTGFITSACGVTIYEGTALPEAYRGNSFTCEPAGNLVHHDVLLPNGVTFVAKRAYPTNEFLASPDNWFRPVNLANGPDGALYVCDMYRKTIEHPDYLPEATRKVTDFESGKAMGRIYRIVAEKPRAKSRRREPTDPDSVLRPRDILAISFGDSPEATQLPEVTIKEDGTITLPLHQTFTAAGKTPRQLEKEIRGRYVPRLYVELIVTVNLVGKPALLPKIDLGKMSPKELVGQFSNPNIWWRMTAQRLLLERQDAITASPSLRSLLASGKTPEARIHALRTLEGLKIYSGMQGHPAVTDEDIGHALADPHPAVREHGIQLAESSVTGLVAMAAQSLTNYAAREFLRKHGAGAAMIASRLVTLADDPDPRVRFQCALALGGIRTPPPAPGTKPWKRPIPTDDQVVAALVKIGTRDLDDKWTRAAVLSAITHREELFLHDFLAVAARESPLSLAPMMSELGHIIAAGVPSEKLVPSLQDIVASKSSTDLGWQMAAVSGFGEGLKARGPSTKGRPGLLALFDGGSADVRQGLEYLLKRASDMALDSRQPLSLRLPAISLLSQAEYATAGEPLEKLIEPQQPSEIQTAAIRALGQLSKPEAGPALVKRERWNAYTPAVRDVVLSALMVNTNFLQSLFTAIEKGDVPAWTVNADRRNQLMRHKDEAIQNRATALFKNLTPGDRMKVYEESKSVLALKPDGKNGHAVFQRLCTPCHVFAGEGHAVGPDLTGIRNQPADVLLLHIVVPEYEIVPIYTCYNVETKDGQSFSGLLAAETPATITLRMAQGVEQKIARSDVASMQTSRLSLMPQELEKAMSKQELADLIAFLKGQ